MKDLFIYFICCILYGCNVRKNEQYLEIYYMAPNVSTPYSYPCSKIYEDKLNERINYRKIDDPKQYKEFINLFNQYQITNDSTGINARIKVLVYSQSKTDTLCLGEHFNTYKNGLKMKDNQQLLKYVKEIIDFENTIPPFVKKHQKK